MPRIVLTLSQAVIDEIDKQSRETQTTLNEYLNRKVTELFTGKETSDLEKVVEHIISEINKDTFEVEKPFLISEIDGVNELIKEVSKGSSEKAFRARVGRYFNALTNTKRISNTIRAVDAKTGELSFRNRAALYKKVE